MSDTKLDCSILNKKFFWLKPVLNKWLEINQGYLLESEYTDALYWHEERTNVGVLAGAVWSVGGYAAEEFSAFKGRGSSKRNGRVDLYLEIGDHTSVCEAKQRWVCISPKRLVKPYREQIDSTLDAVDEDIRLTDQSFSKDQGLSISFFPTYEAPKNRTNQLKQFYTAVKETDCCFYAWFENTSGKDLVGDKRVICNAVALIGRSIQ